MTLEWNWKTNRLWVATRLLFLTASQSESDSAQFLTWGLLQLHIRLLASSPNLRDFVESYNPENLNLADLPLQLLPHVWNRRCSLLPEGNLTRRSHRIICWRMVLYPRRLEAHHSYWRRPAAFGFHSICKGSAVLFVIAKLMNCSKRSKNDPPNGRPVYSRAT